jgi:hypothetical protein
MGSRSAALAADPRRIRSSSNPAPESTPISALGMSFCGSPSEAAAEPPETLFCTEFWPCTPLVISCSGIMVLTKSLGSRVSNIRQILANTIVSPVIRAKDMFWQQGNFMPKTSTSIFMERGKRENIFIKDYI